MLQPQHFSEPNAHQTYTNQMRCIRSIPELSKLSTTNRNSYIEIMDRDDFVNDVTYLNYLTEYRSTIDNTLNSYHIFNIENSQSREVRTLLHQNISDVTSLIEDYQNLIAQQESSSESASHENTADLARQTNIGGYCVYSFRTVAESSVTN